jgi:hypothetical protein
MGPTPDVAEKAGGTARPRTAHAPAANVTASSLTLFTNIPLRLVFAIAFVILSCLLVDGVVGAYLLKLKLCALLSPPGIGGISPEPVQ